MALHSLGREAYPGFLQRVTRHANTATNTTRTTEGHSGCGQDLPTPRFFFVETWPDRQDTGGH
jgi:hypothetical protein